jgi:hypothetical protein
MEAQNKSILSKKTGGPIDLRADNFVQLDSFFSTMFHQIVFNHSAATNNHSGDRISFR